ncbi:MAG: phosphoribosylformylglycinamidine synthase subunit PurQ [Calditrichia bacterium]|nr:phosphoribosylformylglycinamidine synthase subunit PurQ [Calditrichia bacterium]
MRAAIIVFPGSNCDHDAYIAFKKILDQPTDFVWHKETNLDSYDLIVLPGGFSYGDYLRCGAIARFSPVMKEVIEKSKLGVKVIGICNGFQILTESGLLPGALTMNKYRQFICKDVNLKVENRQTVFTHLCNEKEVLTIPIAHSEGNYYCSAEELSQLEANNQIVFRYSTPDGNINTEANPNGSIVNIAGIINNTGNVLGMMPHPERNAEHLLGNSDGKKILSSIVDSFRRN